MLHRVFASLLCVLGVAALGLGIASATVWRPSDTLVASATGAPGTTLLVTEPGVLDLADEQVRVAARGTSGRVVLVLGRSEDIDAWVGDDKHTRVTGLADWHVLATDTVEGRAQDAEDADAEDADADAEDADAEDADAEDADAEDADAEDADAEDADAEDADAEEPAPAPDPSGSDMWWTEISAPGEAVLDWTGEEGRWSVLVASVGSEPGPAQISLTWPQEVRTPWLLPGVLVGSVLLLLGLAWWALIVVATRGAGTVDAVDEPMVDTTGMTRRQLRELEERRAATRRHQPGIVSALGFLVPRSAPPDPTSERAPEHTAPVVPETPAPESHWPATSSPGTPSDEGQHPSEAAPGRRRGLPWGRVRGGRGDAGGAAAPEATAEPSPTPEAEPPVWAPPAPPQSAEPPRSSADAWRRTWGLIGDDDGGRPVWRPVSESDEDQQDGGRR